MLARLAEQERLDQLSAWQRRIRRAEHVREVEGLLAVKRGLQETALVRNLHASVECSATWHLIHTIACC